MPICKQYSLPEKNLYRVRESNAQCLKVHHLQNAGVASVLRQKSGLFTVDLHFNGKALLKANAQKRHMLDKQFKHQTINVVDS